ncbi:phosphopantetheine-binding protein [Butyricimonas virosa]|uniref:phosphopantetheine-binding protein n=1 Tax=Butyricimonas virosa TaxID=544645 RepID=UPI003CFF831C
MTQEEKIALLEDMLELDANTLTPETELSAIEEYDSMAKLSLIVLMDEECGKKLTGEQIRAFKTVQNVIDFMG